jgi:hypothetical protein
MHLLIERFVAVLDDFTVLFLENCPRCHALILYADQGHSCGGVIDVTEVARQEAQSYACLMQKVKKIYTLPDFDTPRE